MKKFLFVALLAVLITTVACAGATLPIPPGSAPTAPTAVPPTVAPTVAPTKAPATKASTGWTHNPALPAPAGYPGWVREADHDQSDGLPREVELHALRNDQIFLIFGDRGNVPSIGDVGGSTTCYLIVSRGPMIWTTQPKDGEFGLISWPVRSKFELFDVDASANVYAWAAAKVEALKTAYPLTCAKGVDLWIK
jgi:hypothetical protein